MLITSRDNQTIKLVQKLSQKKYREETGLFIVEGVRAVNDVCAFDSTLIDKVFVSESKAELYPQAIIVKDDIFAKLTDTESGQGVLAIVKKPQAAAPTSDYALFLDGIRDPGNLGTLIRTACAAGYNDIFLRDCADPYSGKVVRSTMSAIVKVNLINADVTALKEMKSRGFRIIAADMDGKSIFANETAKNKVCVVVGGEANGVTSEVINLCDEIYSIPMEGDIESLNAAVSGAIIMYTIKYDKRGK